MSLAGQSAHNSAYNTELYLLDLDYEADQSGKIQFVLLDLIN